MTWPHPSTHPPTHPNQPNHTPMWGSLHRFQIFKRNWNISISSSAIEFWLIPGVPPGGWGGWVDVGGGWWEGAPHTSAHACACTHAHARAHTYDIIGNSQGFPQWGRPFAWNYHVYHARVCGACTCMCTCVWGTPQPPPTPIHPPPNPQSRREPKTPKFNKSWTNRDNSILFEDSLPLNIPELIKTIADYPRHPPPTWPPRAEETQIRRITITLERIEIIQFCLKIWDTWTLLYTYRLGLMCRWGGVLFQMTLLCFSCKEVLLWPSNKKNFLFLHWIPLDHI